jgi:hypothetical protein
MGDLLREGPRVSLPVALLAIIAWAALLVASFISMHRRHRGLAAIAAIGTVALLGSTIAAIEIPPTEQFGIIAQNYYWAWPIATFMATGIVGSALRGPFRLLRQTSGRETVEAVALAGAMLTAVAAVPLLRPTNLLPETDHEWAVSREVARPLLDQLGASLDAGQITWPVLIDLGAVRHVRYTLLAELQRRGIDFVFSAGSTDLSRFGRDRCDDGTAGYLLTLRGGPGAVQLRSSDALLATVPGLTVEQADRSAELAVRFGDALRDGSITVDVGVIDYLGGDVPAALDQVLASPDLPARRLATFLGNWSRFGAVEVAADLSTPLAEWEALERRAVDDRMAIYLRPISQHRPNLCAALDPGDDFRQHASSSLPRPEVV